MINELEMEVKSVHFRSGIKTNFWVRSCSAKIEMTSEAERNWLECHVLASHTAGQALIKNAPGNLDVTSEVLVCPPDRLTCTARKPGVSTKGSGGHTR